MYAQSPKSITIADLYDLQLVGKQIEVLEDKGGKVTINEILTPEVQKKFKSYHKNIYTKPPSNDQIWFKITISNHTTEDVWINLASVTVWYVDFYAPDNAGKYYLKSQTGMMRPMQKKSYPTNNFWLPLSAEGRQDFQTYYIKISSERTLEIPMYVGTLHALHKHNTQRDFIVAGFMGIVLVMFLYNLSLFTVVQDKIYLIYSCHLGIVAFSTAYLNNYSFFHWFWFIPYTYWQVYIYTWLPFSTFFICLFALSYLDLKRNLPAFYYLVLGFMCIHGLVFPILNTFFTSVVVLSVPFQFVGLGTYLTCLAAGFILHFKKNNKNASYYILGWSFVILGVLVYLFVLNGFLPLNFITENSLIWGITFEIFLFSLALGDRVNQIRKDNNRLIKEQNMMLERKVEERTRELNQQSLQLKELNHTKDKLFAIIGHDLKSPINSLKALLDLLASKNITVEEFMQFSSNLKNSVEHIHFTLNNLLQWANSQMQGIEVHPQMIDLHILAQESIDLFEEIAQKKQIKLHNDILPAQLAWADEDQINLVFRNLISNALKFTEMGGAIFIKTHTPTYAQPNMQLISIQDTGIGISSEAMKHLFKTQANNSTQGTQGEKGTGLGLSLCQDFVMRNHGEIWVESTVGKGTTFYFSLPTHKVTAMQQDDLILGKL